MNVAAMLRALAASTLILTCSCATRTVKEPRWHVETFRKCDRGQTANPCPLVTEYVRTPE